MSSKYILPLLIAIYVSGCGADSHLDCQPLLDQQHSVMRQMMHTVSANVRAAPADINTCFDWYRQDQAAITGTYDQQYNGCIDVSEAAKKSLSALSAQERSKLESRGQSICSALSECESLDDSLQFYYCYNNASSSNTQNLYNLSVESERCLNDITIQYKNIAGEERICTAAVRNDYVNSLSDSASNLNKCLMGQWSPPVTTEAPTIDGTTENVDDSEADRSYHPLAYILKRL